MIFDVSRIRLNGLKDYIASYLINETLCSQENLVMLINPIISDLTQRDHRESMLSIPTIKTIKQKYLAFGENLASQLNTVKNKDFSHLPRPADFKFP